MDQRTSTENNEAPDARRASSDGLWCRLWDSARHAATPPTIDCLHQGAQVFTRSEKLSADMQVAMGVARLAKLDGFAARRRESFAYVQAALEAPADR
jgi:hypothetical protein